MVYRKLGKTGLSVSVIGYGAFKIGRNQKIKYPETYALPGVNQVKTFLKTVIDLGINYIDTAPAYGISEEQIGKCLEENRNDLILSTKVGEQFIHGRSVYDFSQKAVEKSIHNSLKKLKIDCIDIVYVHSDGNDKQIIQNSAVVEVLQNFKSKGMIRFVGMSCKTDEGIVLAMPWSDVLMLEYNLNRKQNKKEIQQAFENGIGVVVKKGLGSGWLAPETAIRFVLSHQGVSTLLIATSKVEHLKENIEFACDLINQ